MPGLLEALSSSSVYTEWEQRNRCDVGAAICWVQTCLWTSVQNTTLTSPSEPSGTEGSVISSWAWTHQVEDNESSWTWNTISGALCFPATVPPSSIWRIVTFPYPCIACVTLSFSTCLVGTSSAPELERWNKASKTRETSKVGKEGGRKRLRI